MAKLALLTLPRPARAESTRTFTDPEQPGAELSLILRKLDPCECAVAMDRAAGFCQKYAATGYPLPNGTAVELTESLCQSLCMVEAMQCGPAEDRYSREELVGLLANMPTAGMEVLCWAGELNAGAGETAGN